MARLRFPLNPSETNPKQFLIEYRFPLLKPLRASAVNVDTFERLGIQQSRQKIEKEVAEFQAQLNSLTDEKIQSMVREVKAEIAEKSKKRAEENERNMYYNKPSSYADFQYWAKMPYWSLEECTALSFGRSPDVIKIKKMESIKLVSTFAKKLLDTHRILQRATTMDQLAKSNIPGFYVAWALRNGISIPEKLTVAVEANGHQIADWKTHYEQSVKQLQELQHLNDYQNKQMEESLQKIERLTAKPHSKKSESNADLHPRTHDNLLQLIIVMAVDG